MPDIGKGQAPGTGAGFSDSGASLGAGVGDIAGFSAGLEAGFLTVVFGAAVLTIGFFAAGLAIFFVAGFFTAVLLAAGFFAATFFDGFFAAVFFAVDFLAATFFAAGFLAPVFFAAGFFAVVFFAGGFLVAFAATFFAGFLATAFFAAGFFAATFFAGFLAAAFLAAGFFAAPGLGFVAISNLLFQVIGHAVSTATLPIASHIGQRPDGTSSLLARSYYCYNTVNPKMLKTDPCRLVGRARPASKPFVRPGRFGNGSRNSSGIITDYQHAVRYFVTRAAKDQSQFSAPPV